MTTWANNKVASRGKHIDSFKDPTLSTGLFLIDLIDSVHPGVVIQKIISAGVTQEDKMLNAKYLNSKHTQHVHGDKELKVKKICNLTNKKNWRKYIPRLGRYCGSKTENDFNVNWNFDGFRR